MANARNGHSIAAGRRGGLPIISPHVKPVISVEDWETMAPLGDKAMRSISLVKAASEKIPIPLKFTTEEGSSSRPTTPTLRSKLAPNSRPSTPNASTPRPQGSHALHPRDPVQTPQQFYDWFSIVDRSVAHSQEAHFRSHISNVADHLETCDLLTQRISEIEREVYEMLQGWRSVEESGNSIKDASEKLLQERDKLLLLTEDISARLEYFQELEHATRMLNHPGEALVLQTDFLYMVERVDICIEYLKAHRDFKESEVYLLRFQQCMTRAMTLIRMYFVGSLRALTTDVSRRMSEKDVSPTAQMHLLYTRFQSVSVQLAPLLRELERRTRVHPDDLSTLLSECHTAYFSARKGLLAGRLTEEIKGLDPARTELVELARAGCGYLKQLCTDEFILFRAFFSTGEDQLYPFLENLCDYLYDDLRPRILHEPRLTALCEVCTVLQALMVLDVPLGPASSDDEEVDSSGDDLTIDFGQPPKKGLDRLHISHLLQMILQDAQTRLFFKAQSFIQSDIRSYAPKPEDLAYPDKLVDARKPLAGNRIKEKESVSQLFQLPSIEKQETWFPTLRKTIWVLSQLHDFVKPAIFEDIAQEAVGLCLQSLLAASEMVKMRNPPSTALDGQLFLIRHLLILKEMTQNLEFTRKDTVHSADFGGVTDTLTSLLSRTTSLLPDSFVASFGISRSSETIADTKQGIDFELKCACEGVISYCVDSISEPLSKWTERVQEQSKTRGELPVPGQQSTPLTNQEWAQQSAAEQLDRNTREACEGHLRSAVRRMRLYLEDEKTVSILISHIQDRVFDDYGSFRSVIWNMYAGGLRDMVMSTVQFREFLNTVCEVEVRTGSSS